LLRVELAIQSVKVVHPVPPESTATSHGGPREAYFHGKLQCMPLGVNAGTTSVGQEEELFLDINQDIWNPALGHPTNEKAESPSKLQGRYSWPFTIYLPAMITVKTHKTSGLFNLPPNFSEKASPAYIDYKLSVTIRRPALRVNQTCVYIHLFFWQKITIRSLCENIVLVQILLICPSAPLIRRLCCASWPTVRVVTSSVPMVIHRGGMFYPR
jgi:hypothetical protein